MGRPARSTAPSNFLAMMGSDSENDLAGEQDSSDFDGDDGEEEEEISVASMVSESDDEGAGGKKRGKAAAPAPKKPPAKKSKAGPPKATPAAVPKAPAAVPKAPTATPMQVVSREANEDTSPSDTPVSKAGSTAAPFSAATKKPAPVASSPATSDVSSATPTTEKKKAAPKKPAAPKKAAAGSGPGAAKPKEAPVKNASDASTMILDYLNTTNRPYGSQNVFDNLHRKIPLGVVKAQLDVLADAGKLNRKEYGKSRIYFALQEECDTSSMSTDLASWEAKAKTAKEERAKLAKQKADLEATVRGLNQSMTEEQLAKALEELTLENGQREVKLESLRKLADASTGAGQQADVRNSLGTLRAELKKYRNMWVQRKRNVMNALGVISDGMDKPVKTLIADIGIETDEEYGAQPPPLP